MSYQRDTVAKQRKEENIISEWLEKNIIQYLTAFQLVIVVLGYFILGPFVATFVALLDGSVIPTLYQALVFVAFCVVVICFILLAIAVYSKDKTVKIETAKKVEVTPLEEYNIKNGLISLLKLIGLSATVEKTPDKGYVDTPTAASLIQEMPLEELTALLQKEVLRRNEDG